MKSTIETMLEAALGRRPERLAPLSGGMVASVFLAVMPGGTKYVAKVDPRPDADFRVEGYMLEYLARHTALPVPRVHVATRELLVIDYVAHGDSDSDSGARADARLAERHAAELLAALHAHTSPTYGFERDTLIGPLPQPNPATASWVEFFATQRLLYMGRLCVDAGRMTNRTLERLEKLCERLDSLIGPPAAPGLVHGDVWSGNVLRAGGRIAAFVDPAIHYADPEVELAFIGLFHTFGEAFYERYGDLRPIREGFFEQREALYNLYPLLVHTRLFGGGYLASVERTLERFGV